MLPEFKRNLLTGLSFNNAVEELTAELDKYTHQRRNEIEKSKKEASFVEDGLSWPEGTLPHNMAIAILKEYSAELGQPITRGIIAREPAKQAEQESEKGA